MLDAQAGTKTVLGLRNSHPVVLKSWGHRDRGKAVEQETGRTDPLGSGQPHRVKQAPTVESALSLQTGGLGPALPLTRCVTKDSDSPSLDTFPAL